MKRLILLILSTLKSQELPKHVSNISSIYDQQFKEQHTFGYDAMYKQLVEAFLFPVVSNNPVCLSVFQPVCLCHCLYLVALRRVFE